MFVNLRLELELVHLKFSQVYGHQFYATQSRGDVEKITPVK